MSTETHTIQVTVNGETTTHDVPARLLLSDFIRQRLKLTGTHIGCEHGVCGACTILVEGIPMRACLLFAVQADGLRLETVEGIADEDGTLSFLQSAFREHHALQCGFCTPGILMTMKAFLETTPNPDEAQVREALSGNLCRCTGYQHIVDAVLAVAGRSPGAGERDDA